MYIGQVRTTIELRDDQRDALADLARKRGERGYSALVQEAVDQFLRSSREADRERRLAAFDDAFGSISDEAAEHMRATIRDRWRTSAIAPPTEATLWDNLVEMHFSDI
jgi:hypothetical protein